jgi:MFS transporter, putative metabolite:H+ symporter
VTTPSDGTVSKRVVLAAALGTFVDVVDLTLFQSVRVASLRAIGVAPADLFRVGALLLNVQLAGLVIGGLAWGAIADRRGRRTVLFGSILMYSLATLMNAWVETVPGYAVLRFISGFGLAGEVGAGITLIVEMMPPSTRGYGTTIAAACGVFGGLGGAFLATYFPWRTAFIIGGVCGLGLLVLRASTYESTMYARSREAAPARGVTLIKNPARLKRYVLALLVALPMFFVLMLVAPFAPELAAGMSPPQAITAAVATSMVSIGLTTGDAFTGLVSQWLKSRKRPLLYSLVAMAVLIGVLCFAPIQSGFLLRALILGLGFCAGYYVLFLTNIAEQFGTNVRGTATVNAPNVMRATAIPMNILLRSLGPRFGILNAAALIGGGCIVIALVCLKLLPETYGRNLDYDEE